LIAIDGKTIRRSFQKADKRAAIHLVSAWSETNSLVLLSLFGAKWRRTRKAMKSRQFRDF